jgi:hypothetical protein
MTGGLICAREPETLARKQKGPAHAQGLDALAAEVWLPDLGSNQGPTD